MKPVFALSLLFVLMVCDTNAQYPPFTKWYQNPLGFKPLSLHTSSGIIIPALLASAILLLTKDKREQPRKLSYYSDAGISFGYTGSRTTVYQGNVGLLLPVRSFMTLGAEYTTYRMTDAVNNTWGFGLRPFVRFYPIRGNQLRIFVQSGAGLIYFLETYPQPSGFFGDNRTGTHLNGCPKYGLGAEFSLGRHLDGQVGLWHVHVSNGNNPSVDRNPGHDSNGFSIGLQLK